MIDGEKLGQAGSHLGEGARQSVTEGSERLPGETEEWSFKAEA